MNNLRIFMLTTICALFVMHVYAQGFLHVYDESFSKSDILQDMVNVNDTLVFYGYGFETDSTLDFGAKFFKMDTSGNILLERQVINPDTIWTVTDWFFKKILHTQDGGFLITGSAIILEGDFAYNIYAMKMDRDLNLEWTRLYEGELYMSHGSMVETPDGFLIVGYIRQPNSSLALDIVLIKTDKKGNELWRRQYGKYEYTELAADMFKLSNNSYLIHGTLENYPHWDDPSWPVATWGSSYIFAVDSLGNKLWEFSADSNANEAVFYKILQEEDLSWISIELTWELYQGGQTESYEGLPMIVKRDKDFNVLWKHEFGLFGFNNRFTDLNRTPDGNFLASGYLSYDENINLQAVHFKFSPEGDSIWMRLDTVYDGLQRMQIQSTEVLASGSIISIGYIRLGPYGETGFIMKLSPDGCMDTLNCIPLSIDEGIWYDPYGLKVYPNPSSDRLTLDVPESWSGTAWLIVRDIQGRTVLQDKIEGSVHHLDISFLRSGHYFVELQGRKNKLFGRFVKGE